MILKYSREPGAHPLKVKQGSHGIDIACLIPEGHQILPCNSFRTLKTGIHIMLPRNKSALLIERFSSAQRGLKIVGGLIDPDYTGEVLITVANVYSLDEHLQDGEYIAQLLLLETEQTSIVEVEKDKISNNKHEARKKVVENDEHIKTEGVYEDEEHSS